MELDSLDESANTSKYYPDNFALIKSGEDRKAVITSMVDQTIRILFLKILKPVIREVKKDYPKILDNTIMNIFFEFIQDKTFVQEFSKYLKQKLNEKESD